MHTIHKYPLKPGLNEIVAPVASLPLHVGDQRGEPTVWMHVNIDSADVIHRFEVYGTGQCIGETTRDLDGLVYLGTAVGPAFVWHVFKRMYGEAQQGVVL